jgi:RNA polymerase sigma factor (TIGR02999 family)
MDSDRPSDPPRPSEPPGSSGPADRTLPIERLYGELRALAQRYLQREERRHTLQPTALVHEAFLRLARTPVRGGGEDGEAPTIEVKAAAARAMREILVDHARRRDSVKRGGGRPRGGVEVEGAGLAAPGGADPLDVLELDLALTELGRVDPRRARVVELRFFGGLTNAEVAAEVAVAPKTAESDWYFARAWLRRHLERGDRGHGAGA